MILFSMKGRVLVGIGIFAGALLAFYLVVYLSGVRYRETLSIKISQQNKRLIQLEKKFQELEKLKEENQKIRKKLTSLEDRLKGSQTSFLYELGIRGRVYRIEYLEITPLPGVKEKYYFRIPVKIHLYGRYHNLGMLISDMVKRGGIGSFTVDDILLKSSPKKEYTIEANLTLSLYRYGKSAISQKEDILSPGAILDEGGVFSSGNDLSEKLRRRRR